MRKNEITWAGMLCEAVSLVAAVLYIGLQIYFTVVYMPDMGAIIVNIATMVLVYAGLTMLTIYPEKVNGLSREVCSGQIRVYTVRMLRVCKLIFVIGILFACICDVMGYTINAGYSLVVVILLIAVAAYYEIKIIRIFRKNQKK